MRIEYHRTLIADRVRNEAFEKALGTVIKKGETTVADIGAGTGLLALMAAKRGAREVFLYETAEVAGVAAKVLKANGARNCHLIPCHSTEMVDPPKVDVIVSETLGNYALEEHIIETLADAKKRFLKPGGTMIPRRIEQYVAPVVSDRIHREFSAWDETGFEMSVARTMSLNNIYVRTLAPEELLEAKMWDTVELGSDARSARKGEASWKLRRAASIYGFAVWWRAELVPGVTLSTAPDAPRTHWEQLYFPLLSPITAKGGETVSIALRSRTSQESGTHVAWTAKHADGKGSEVVRQALNLDKGYLP
ncbi:MAG TPA: 50S ribosomal protein L11 methyltransferase [Hyphomicrobium sp.]|nr:50S ribosomal protein L11 methyltransferase [Hyphomicrobium sp.]